MTPFTTDAGTVRLLEDLTPAGRQVLFGFLRRCDSQRTHGLVESATLQSIHFHRRDIVSMHLERTPSDKDRKILSTTDFTSGARWRRGSLRMPRTEIPQTLLSAVKGRLIEEVVSGAPLGGYRIKHAVHDRSSKGTTLRLRCDGEVQADIPYEDPPARTPIPSLEGW